MFVITLSVGGCRGGQKESPVVGAPTLENLVSSDDNPEHSLQYIVICWICGRRINPEDFSLDEQKPRSSQIPLGNQEHTEVSNAVQDTI